MELTRRDLRKLPFFFDATDGLNIAQIRTRARNANRRKGGVALVVVDYLQLIKGPAHGRDPRHREMSDITAGLKGLAKELNVAVLALSQLSRETERRDDRRPQLSDLKESGSIEQDADVVMFVHREEYYLRYEKVPDEGTHARLNYDRRVVLTRGVAEIIIAKNRHGPAGTLQLGFDGNLTSFKPEPDERAPLPQTADEERVKQRSLSKEATMLWGVLRSLMISTARVCTDEDRETDNRLPRNTRVLDRAFALQRYGTEVFGPGADMKKVETSFVNAMKELRAREFAYYTGTDQEPLIWCPTLHK